MHAFTNLNKPVDFAGRMVYNPAGIEVFNFGKYKDKSVEEVFNTDPSYYSWMQQGNFPLHTKRCLEKIWVRWANKKEQAKQIKQVSPVKTFSPAQPVKPNTDKQKAAPIDSSMLEQLKLKFSK